MAQALSIKNHSAEKDSLTSTKIPKHIQSSKLKSRFFQVLVLKKDGSFWINWTVMGLNFNTSVRYFQV